MKKVFKYIFSFVAFFFILSLTLTSCKKVEFKDNEYLQMVNVDESYDLSYSDKSGLKTYYLTVPSTEESISLDKIDDMIHLKHFYKYGIYYDFLGTNKYISSQIRLNYGYNDAYIIVSDRKDIEKYTFLLSIYRTKEYKIVFDGSMFGLKPLIINAIQGDIIDEPDYLKDIKGYYLDGWFTKDGLVSFPLTVDFDEIDITLTPYCKPLQFKINYELNGGIVKENNPVYYYYNEQIKIYDPIKNGYTFAGWYYDDKFTNEVNVNSMTRLCEDVTLHALFIEGNQVVLYELQDDNTYAIKKALYDKIAEFIIPSTYNDLPVTTIKASAFANCVRLNNLVIPRSITSIEANAFFNCYSLPNVFIPSSVNNIGSWAFEGCTDTFIFIERKKDEANYDQGFASDPKKVIYGVNGYGYENGLFYYSLANEGHIYKIGNKLEDFKLDILTIYTTLKDGTKITHIDSDVLDNKNKDIIREIIFQPGLINIASNSFNRLNNLTKITFLEGLSDNKLTIEYGAFSECRFLKTVRLPQNINTIKEHAFFACRALIEVYIPESIEVIEARAFNGCAYNDTLWLRFEGDRVDGLKKDFDYLGTYVSSSQKVTIIRAHCVYFTKPVYS